MRKSGHKLTPAAKVQVCLALLLLLGITMALLLPVSGKTQPDFLCGQLVVFTEADYNSPVFGSLSFWRALQRHTSSFSNVAAFDQQIVPLDDAKSHSLVHLTQVTANFLRTAGASFHLQGPPLEAAEGLVYLSREYWQKEFSADPQIVGRTISIKRRIYCIAGVVADLPLDIPTDVWVLMKAPGSDFASAAKSFKFVARLHQDVSWEVARADLKKFMTAQKETFEQEAFATDLCLSPLQKPAPFLPLVEQAPSSGTSLHAAILRE